MVGAGSFWPVFGIIRHEMSKTPILPVEGGGRGVIILSWVKVHVESLEMKHQK